MGWPIAFILELFTWKVLYPPYDRVSLKNGRIKRPSLFQGFAITDLLQMQKLNHPDSGFGSSHLGNCSTLVMNHFRKAGQRDMVPRLANVGKMLTCSGLP